MELIVEAASLVADFGDNDSEVDDAGEFELAAAAAALKAFVNGVAVLADDTTFGLTDVGELNPVKGLLEVGVPNTLERPPKAIVVAG